MPHHVYQSTDFERLLDDVETLTAAGAPVPPATVTALGIWTALRDAVPPPAVLPFAKLTADNAAEELAVAASVNSVRAEALKLTAGLWRPYGQNAAVALNDNVDALLAHLAPTVVKAADDLAKACKTLPYPADPADVLARGLATTHRRVVEACNALDSALALFRAWTGDYSADRIDLVADGPVDLTHLWTRPDDPTTGFIVADSQFGDGPFPQWHHRYVPTLNDVNLDRFKFGTGWHCAVSAGLRPVLV